MASYSVSFSSFSVSSFKTDENKLLKYGGNDLRNVTIAEALLTPHLSFFFLEKKINSELRLLNSCNLRVFYRMTK
jgi:hypothetical protein